jgi:hypothetical protein
MGKVSAGVISIGEIRGQLLALLDDMNYFYKLLVAKYKKTTITRVTVTN